MNIEAFKAGYYKACDVQEAFEDSEDLSIEVFKEMIGNIYAYLDQYPNNDFSAYLDFIIDQARGKPV